MFFPSQTSDPLQFKTETSSFEVFPGRSISFCDRFTYLGSLLTPDLSDKAEISRRIGLAHGQMKLNEPLLRNKKIKLEIRINMYMAFVVNTLLYGCDTWTILSTDYQRLSSFHTKMCRKLLNLSMHQVKSYKIKNEDVLERVELPSMDKIIKTRQLRFLERIAHMEDNRFPRMLIGSHLKRRDGEQARRGNIGSTRSTLRSTLEDAGLCTKGSGGDLKEWIPRIKDPKFFRTIEEKLGLKKDSFKSLSKRMSNRKQ
jgi:hypothetical protein